MRYNSFADLVKFFGNGSKPCTPDEFLRFWISLTLEERMEFRIAELS
jgi:hypothetical protein